MEEVKLTEKQQRFADFYIETGNAAESAVRAGYSKKTARNIGSENLTKPYISEYIQARNKELEDSRIADMREVKQFWTEMLRSNSVEPKDRLKASDFIAKTNGAYLERVEHSGGVEVTNALTGLSTEELRKMVDKMQ